jgi:hypothetical protein
MRIKFVAGNWKMNGNLASNQALLQALLPPLAKVAGVKCAVCAPFPYLAQVQQLLSGSGVAWGAQNVSQHDAGAYTGEVSAAMLVDFGCRYAIVGHSERRTLFGESSETVALKYAAALKAGLTPILCVGETLAEREAGETERVVGAGLLGFVGLQVQQLTSITDIVGDVLGGYIGRANALTGSFTVERGILSTQDTTLANPDAHALAHGKVNLSAWTLDMLTDFYRNIAGDSPWLTMALTGKLDAPNVRLAGLAFSPENLLPGALEGLQSAPSAVIDTVVPGLLQGLPKGGASPAAGAITEPLETLQGTVEGILGGSKPAQPAKPVAAPKPAAKPKKEPQILDQIIPGVKGLFD